MKRKNRHKYPEIYQGGKNPRKYFEGWYFRHTSEDTGNTLVVIPGVSYSKGDSHAFIQVITGNPQKTFYIRFAISDFSYSPTDFHIEIGANIFSSDGVHLDIRTETLSLYADLSYGTFTKIDRSPLSPNIMGFFSYFPFMECNHGIVSLSHELSGYVVFNGNKSKYDGGKGYVEKDWGKSFPEKYIWMQSNHFEKDTSVFLSIARIPFLGMSFNGLIAILSINGKQYRFSTYNGSKYRIYQNNDESLHIELSGKALRLDIVTCSKTGHVLKAPRRGRMSEEITETLEGEIGLSLFEDDKLIHKDTGTNLGLEILWENV